MSLPTGRAAVFLDRDGVLNELVMDSLSGTLESPLHTDDVRLAPGAAAGAVALARLGFALVCVSNQPAAAKGRVSLEQLLAVHNRVLELLDKQDVALAASRLCVHHEHGVVPELTGPCNCRKPSPGMLLESARSLGIDFRISWMVGDTDADVAAGKAAGCMTLLIRNPGSAHKRLQGVEPDLVAEDFTQAVEQITARTSETIGVNR